MPEVVQTEIVPVVRQSTAQTPSDRALGTIWRLTSLLQLPLWALVSLGAYLLFRLGWGILTFNDVPAAHKELMGEIEQAKVELRKLGVSVD